MTARSSFSILSISLFLLLATACASTRDQSSLGEVIDDTVITTRVKAAIFNEPTLRVGEINVETLKGVVQLSGFVTNQSEIERAAQVAGAVGGVLSIRNDIQLR